MFLSEIYLLFKLKQLVGTSTQDSWMNEIRVDFRIVDTIHLFLHLIQYLYFINFPHFT